MRSPGEMWGMVEEGNGHQRGGRTAWRGDSRVQTRRTCKRVRTVLHGTLGHLPTQGRDLAPPGGHHMAAAHTSHPALGLLRSACAEEVRGSPTRHSVMPTRGPYSEDVGLPREPGAPGAPRTGALTTLRSSRRQSAPQLLSLPVAESQPRPGPAPSSSAAPPSPRPRLRPRPAPCPGPAPRRLRPTQAPPPGPAPPLRAVRDGGGVEAGVATARAGVLGRDFRRCSRASSGCARELSGRHPGHEGEPRGGRPGWCPRPAFGTPAPPLRTASVPLREVGAGGARESGVSGRGPEGRVRQSVWVPVGGPVSETLDEREGP